MSMIHITHINFGTTGVVKEENSDEQLLHTIGITHNFYKLKQNIYKFSFWQGGPGQPQDLGRNISMWMLLERVRFTLDGVECNKIGVSYETFGRQPNFCSSPFWTCLHNQLWNFREVGTAILFFFLYLIFPILLFWFHFFHFFFSSSFAAVCTPYLEYFFSGILVFISYVGTTWPKCLIC